MFIVALFSDQDMETTKVFCNKRSDKEDAVCIYIYTMEYYPATRKD